MRNAYASGAAHQIPEDDAMRKKRPDEVAEKVCGNCSQVFRGVVHPKKGGGVTHRGSRGVQMTWAAAEPVGRRLVRCLA